MEQIKNIALYARVSTGRQENEQTINNQIMAANELMEKRGYKIVQNYLDDGYTHEILRRPALDALRSDARLKIWDAVVVYDMDRISRKFAYQELITDELTELGVEIICCTISPPKNPEEKILYGVRGLFAEYERAKISERFRLGKLRKVRAGVYMASVPNYGYKRIPKTESSPATLEIDEHESTVIKQIYSWLVDEHLTLRQIVKRLHDLNIAPRSSKKGVWNSSSLCHMLRNTIYIGKFRWYGNRAVVPEKPLVPGQYKRVKRTSRQKRPEEDWMFIDVPAIIDTDTFAKAQEALKRNFARCARRKKNFYLLAGKVYCPCGMRRTGEGPQKGRYLYYRCCGRVLAFPRKQTCLEKGINAKKLDEIVWEFIVNLMISPTLLAAQVERIAENGLSNVGLSNSAPSLQSEFKRLANQRNRLNEAYINGVFALDVLKSYLEPINRRMEAIEQDIKKVTTLNEETKKFNNSVSEIDVFAQRCKLTIHDLSDEQKRGVVLNVVDSVVASEKVVDISGSIELSDVEKCLNYGYSTNTNRHEQPGLKSTKIPFKHTIHVPEGLIQNLFGNS